MTEWILRFRRRSILPPWRVVLSITPRDPELEQMLRASDESQYAPPVFLMGNKELELREIVRIDLLKREETS